MGGYPVVSLPLLVTNGWVPRRLGRKSEYGSVGGRPFACNIERRHRPSARAPCPHRHRVAEVEARRSPELACHRCVVRCWRTPGSVTRRDRGIEKLGCLIVFTADRPEQREKHSAWLASCGFGGHRSTHNRFVAAEPFAAPEPAAGNTFGRLSPRISATVPFQQHGASIQVRSRVDAAPKLSSRIVQTAGLFACVPFRLGPAHGARIVGARHPQWRAWRA